MAKLAGMIDCFSEVLGMPRTAVEAYVKPLRKAGLIASSGRTGPNTPDMTPGDAANLLLAILCGSTTHAVERVKECGIYPFTDTIIGHERKRETRAITLDLLKLSPDHTLIDLISSLVSADFDYLRGGKIGRDVERFGIFPNLFNDLRGGNAKEFSDVIMMVFALDVSFSSGKATLSSSIIDVGLGDMQVGACKIVYLSKSYTEWSGNLQTTYSVYDETFMSISKYLKS